MVGEFFKICHYDKSFWQNALLGTIYEGVSP